MATGGNTAMQVKVNRFAAFRFIQRHMNDHGSCPSVSAVAQELGIAEATAARHMTALDGADGLPLPCWAPQYSDLDHLPGFSLGLSARRQQRLPACRGEIAIPVDIEMVA